ncbi:MAG TPA: hypothetical protein VNJ01_03665 [Bacteriovoracaceae bacterium]|nr:hypothetical protein [Bacteriovoracaceae bacterium]
MSISVRSFLKSGIGVAISAIFGVCLIKLISYHEGPKGVGAFGLFRQFFQFLAVFYTLGSGYSIVEGLPKSKNKELFIKTASSYSLLVSVILSLLILIFQEQICLAIYSDLKNLHLIRSLPLFIVPLSILQLVKSSLSGEGFIGRSGVVTALPFVLMFAVAIYSRDLFDLYFYSSVLSFLLSLALFQKPLRSLVPKFPIERIKSLENTSISTMLTGASGFMSFLAVKAICTHKLGIWNTGLLEASWSLVAYTTLVFLTSLSVYYLPKVSADPTQVTFRNHYLTFINGIAAVSLILICLGENFFIKLLFTTEFLEMEKLLTWMALGEYLKCLNWFFIFSMIGLSYKKAYIILDLCANALLVGAVYFTDLSLLEEIGICYISFQTFYLLGNLFLNFRFKLVSTAWVVGNLGFGLLLWSALLVIKSYGY